MHSKLLIRDRQKIRFMHRQFAIWALGGVPKFAHSQGQKIKCQTVTLKSGPIKGRIHQLTFIVLGHCGWVDKFYWWITNRLSATLMSPCFMLRAAFARSKVETLRNEGHLNKGHRKLWRRQKAFFSIDLNYLSVAQCVICYAFLLNNNEKTGWN